MVERSQIGPCAADVIWNLSRDALLYTNPNFIPSTLNENLCSFSCNTAEAKELYPELFTSWRQDPMHFEVNGVFPVRELWNHAQNAWEDILTQATVS